MSQKLTPTQKVFKAIATNPGQSRLAIAKATRLETPIVGRAFQTLKKDGLITMKGDRRGASYLISRNKAATTLMTELGLEITRRSAEKAPADTPKAEKAPKVKIEKATPKAKATKAPAKAEKKVTPKAKAPVKKAVKAPAKKVVAPKKAVKTTPKAKAPVKKAVKVTPVEAPAPVEVTPTTEA